MKPESPASGRMALSIGDASIPMTLQTEIEHMSLDEAIVSGLFDMPDEPSMIQIPVTINLMIPDELLQSPEQGLDHGVSHSADGMPPGGLQKPSRRRFANRTKATAAQRIAETIKATLRTDARERLQASDGTPIQLMGIAARDNRGPPPNPDGSIAAAPTSAVKGAAIRPGAAT